MIDLKEKLMKCPVCESVDLTMADRQGVEIDYCPKCRGVWLDRGELDKIIERSAVELAPPSRREPLRQRDLDPAVRVVLEMVARSRVPYCLRA